MPEIIRDPNIPHIDPESITPLIRSPEVSDDLFTSTDVPTPKADDFIRRAFAKRFQALAGGTGQAGRAYFSGGYEKLLNQQEYVANHADLINRRLQDFDPEAVKLAPDIAFRLAKNPDLPGRAMAGIAQQFNSVIPWLKARNSRLANDGFYMRARQYAVATDNDSALRVLDYMQQNMTPEQQEYIFSILRDPNAYQAMLANKVAQERGLEQPTEEQFEASGGAATDLLKSTLGKLFPGFDAIRGRDENLLYSVPSQHPLSEDFMIMLNTMFPASAQMFDLDVPGDFDRFVTNPVDTVRHGVLQGGQSAFQALAIPFMAGMEGYKGLLRSLAKLDFSGLLDVVTPEGVERAAGLDFERSEGLINVAAPEVTTQAAGFAASVGLAPLTAFDEATRGVIRGSGALNLLGLDPSDPDYQAAEDITAGIFQWWLLSNVGRFSRAARAGRALTPSTARAQLGISEGFRASDFFEFASNRVAFRPMRAIGEAMKRTGYELASYRSLTEAVHNTSFIQDAFDFVSRINDSTTDVSTRVGAIKDMFGEVLPVPLAEQLARAARGEMEAIYIDYAQGRRASSQYEIELSRQVADRSVELSRLSSRETITARMDEMSAVADNIHEIRSQIDSATATTLPAEASFEAIIPGMYSESSILGMLDESSRGGVLADLGDNVQQVDASGIPMTGNAPTFVVVRDGTPVSLLTVHETYLTQVTNPAFQRQGLASGLLEKVNEARPDLNVYDKLEHGYATPEGAAYAQAVGRGRVSSEIGVLQESLVQAKKDLRVMLDDMMATKERARDMRLIQAADNARLGRLAGERDGIPVYEYPRINHIKAFVRGYTRNLAGRWLRNLTVRPLRKLGLDLSKFVDELPSYPRLYSPDFTRPADWQEHNVSTATKFLRRAGVDEATVLRLAGDLARVETRQQFYDWITDASKSIDRALPATTPREMRLALTNWFDNPLESRARLGVDTTVQGPVGELRISEPIIPRSNPLDSSAPRIPRPSSPTDFLGHVNLPNVDLAISATSPFKRAYRALKNQGLLGRAAAAPVGAVWSLGHGLLRFGTALWKAPILALRLPAMTMRIQLEQAFRAHAIGEYKAYVPFPGGLILSSRGVDTFMSYLGGPTFGKAYELRAPNSELSRFSRVEDVDLGAIHQQLVDNGPEMQYWEQDMSLYNSRMLEPKSAHYTAVVETLQKINSDWFQRKLLESRGNTSATVDWVVQNLDDPYIRDQMQVLRDSDLALREGRAATDVEMITAWVERSYQALSDFVHGDPLLLESMRTGRMIINPSQRRLESMTDPATGARIVDQIRDASIERDAIRTGIRELAANRDRMLLDENGLASLRALQAELRAVDSRLRQLQGRAGVSKDLIDGEAVINVANTRTVATYLKRKYEANEFQFPNRLSVKRRYDWQERQGVLEAGRQIRNGWNAAWYYPFKAVTWADMKLTRGSLYYQLAHRYHEGLLRQGYTEADATAFAQVRAAAEVRDIMYDLSARTSVQRSLRDTFWFAPATQEIMYTWLVKIPRTYYGLSGYFIVPAKVQAVLNILEGAGVIQENEDGEKVIPVPGFGALIDGLFPGEQNFGQHEYIKLEGLNLVLSAPYPSLSTLPAAGLARLARTYGGAFKTLSDIFNQFGADIQAVPRQITYAWEAITGNPPPFEFLSPDYAKAQYDRSFDQALQWSFAEMTEGGRAVPRPEQYDTREEYETARDDFMADMMASAEEYFKGMAVIRLAGSSTTPATVYVSEQERNEWRKYFGQVIDPAGNEEETGRYSDRQKELIDQYISRHPNSLAYTIGYTVYGDKERDLPYEPTGDDEFFESFYTGERRVLSPEEFSQKLMTIESYRFYLAQQNAALRGIGDDASTLLAHGFERGEAMADFTERWSRYLAYNPDAESQLENSRRSWEERYGIPANSYETERLAITIQKLRELAPYFTGESGIRSEEYKATLAELKALYSEGNTFGEPTSEIGKGMDWYFTNILDPYFEETEDLYDQANQLAQSGQDASAVYDQIREINDRYEAMNRNHDGQNFPSPEEVFWGNKNSAEQDAARLNWITKPPTWLSEFRLDTTGLYPAFEGQDQLLRDLNEFDAYLHQFVVDNDVSASSDYYDRLQDWGDQQRANLAAQYGQPGTRLYELYAATPAVRLTESGFGQDNGTWRDTLDGADYVTEYLEARDLSAKGFSEAAIYYKSWLYQQIEHQRASDSAYNDLWIRLSRSIPDRGYTERQGVLLYEAILFGNFNTDFVPEELIDSIEGAA